MKMFWNTARLPKTISLGICLDDDGAACAVVDDRRSRLRANTVRPRYRMVGCRSDSGGWNGLTEWIEDLCGGDNARVTIVLQRPAAQAKTVPLGRVSQLEAARLLEQNCELFFARTAASSVVATSIEGVGRKTIAIACDAAITAAAVSAGNRAHTMVAGVSAAEIAAVAGLRLLKPGSVRGKCCLLLVFDRWIALVYCNGRRISEIRSAAIQEACVKDVCEKNMLLRRADDNTKLICAATPSLLPGIREMLEADGVVVTELVAMGAEALAAAGAAAAMPESALIVNQELRTERDRRRTRLAVGRAASIMLIACVCAAGYLWHLRKTVEQVDMQRASLQQTLIRARRATVAADAISERAGELQRFAHQRSSNVSLLGRITATLPDDSYLTSLTMQGDDVRCDGWAPSAPAIVPLFESQPWIAEVHLGSSSQRSRDGSAPRDHFSLTMRLKRGAT